ncbi:SCO family protein [Cystobacter fuscus]|uniref:SCO family protein n=1 Tax=Cystobacter fuscus TaxID=43 RepID=UPI0012DDC841|nr:SCO family protein [Cystobacter fuscus]
MSSRSRPASTLFALAFLLLLARRAEAFGPPTHSEPALNTPPSALEAIRVDEKLGAPIPLDTELIDESGQRVTLRQMMSPDRPTVLSLAYFRCPQLCSLVLKGLVKSLSETQLELGKDYHSITLSIDPSDTPEEASKWRARYLQQLGQPGQAPWRFLTGTQEQVKKVADAVGFGYAYDKSTDQYAHAAVVMVLSPQGTVSRYLYGVDFPAMDMRLAINEAAQGKAGITLERVMLSCFKYDPATRRYGFYVFGFLRMWWLVGIGMAATLAVLIRRNARQRSASGNGA